MDMVSKFGKMVPNTRATGDSIRLVDMASSGMSMVMSSRESGSMIRQMATASMSIRTVLGMRVSGKMIFNTDKVKRFGPIILAMKVPTTRAKSMELAFIFGKTDLLTMATGTRTELKVTESTSGKMVGLIPANGRITICMDKVSIHGLMEDAMRVSMKWIKNTATVSILGLMVEFTKALG